MSEEQESYGETPPNSTPIAVSPVNHTVQIIINLGDSGRPFSDIQLARFVRAAMNPETVINEYNRGMTVAANPN